jgi:hypothetical protein
LIEDISSTDVAAISLIDQARVDAINSLTPYGANNFLLNQLGAIYGVQPGAQTNTSVYVVFTNTSGAAGFVIAQGFTVSDGTYQYTVQDGGIIATGGVSAPLYCLAILQGSWDVEPNTVTTIITSLPAGVSITCTNPTAGVEGAAAQTAESYRADVIQAGLAAATGMTALLKTALRNVSGVQSRLVSVQSQSPGWLIIVGGGDPYQVAYAIWSSLFDVSTIVPSSLMVESVTVANPGVVATNLTHGFATGQVINIAGALGMTEINNTPLTVTVLSENTFSIGVNTSSYPAYTGGGVVTPNLRNISASVYDAPDTYLIPIVNPLQQMVTMTITWNTTSNNYVSDTAMAQAAQPAIAAYVNSIAAGQAMNLFELQATFQAATALILPTVLLTRMVFAVTIGGVGVSPESGTGIIAGDTQSYFITTASAITVTQG